MLKTAGLVLLAAPALLLGLCLSSSCVIVDVKPADGPRIIVPVPLTVVRVALAVAPEEATHIALPELDKYAEAVSEALEALSTAPDGVLIEVRDGTEHVKIEKLDGSLAIGVDGKSESVSVVIPLTLAHDVFDAYDGESFETGEILAALGSVSHRKLVHVRNAEEEVRVWVW